MNDRQGPVARRSFDLTTIAKRGGCPARTTDPAPFWPPMSGYRSPRHDRRPAQACATDSLPCSLSRPRAIVAPAILSTSPAAHFREKGTGSATGGAYGPALTMEPTIIHRVWEPATIKRPLSRTCSTAALLFLCYLFVASTFVDVVRSFHLTRFLLISPRSFLHLIFRRRPSSLLTLHLPSNSSLRVSHLLDLTEAKQPAVGKQDLHF